MSRRRVVHYYDYPAPGVRDPGGNDVPGAVPDGGQQPKARVCWRDVPAIVQSFVMSLVGDQRPVGGWDREGTLFGSPGTMLGGPYGPVPWFGSIASRETVPMPEEVILPVAELGYNAIPLETPRYYRGSFWLDDRYADWERGT